MTNQEWWDPKHHMADVVGVGDISWHHHLTGPHREIQTPQYSCEDLKCEKIKTIRLQYSMFDYFDVDLFVVKVKSLM